MNGIRPFRSRKQRPCDLCRKRRSRCAIPEQGSACIECLQTGKPCTFLDNPIDRSASGSNSHNHHQQNEGQPSTIRKRQRSGTDNSMLNNTETSKSTAATYTSTGPSTSAGEPSLSSNATDLISVKPPQTLSVPSTSRPQQQSRSSSGNNNSDTLKVSLEATAISDGLEPTAITMLLTDDLLPVTAGAQDAAPGAIPTHFQISTDRSKPSYFVLPDVPECEFFAIVGVRQIYYFG